MPAAVPQPPFASLAPVDTIRVFRGQQVRLVPFIRNATASVLTRSPSTTPLEGDSVYSFVADESATYVLNVSGRGGSASDAVRVEVIHRPTATILEDPPGDSLDFVGTHGDSASIVAGSGETVFRLSGDTQVGRFRTTVPRPARTTTYVFTVSGAGGSVAETHTVYVPEARIWWSLNERDSILVHVEARDVDSGTLVSVGTLDSVETPLDTLFSASDGFVRDSLFVRPSQRTEYVFTAEGHEQTVTASTTVFPPMDAPSAASTSEGWSLGVGVGGVGVVTGPASFLVPVLSATASSGNWHLTLQAGLRPAGEAGTDALFPLDPRPEFRARTHKLVSVSIVYYLAEWRRASWGVSTNYVGAWQMVRDLDYFTKRVHGPALGPRVRVPLGGPLGGLSLTGGLDFQYANLAEYDEEVASWEFGVTSSIGLSLVFG